MEQARLSRRDFLRGAGLTGAAAAGMLAFPGAGKAFADDGAADAQSTEATDSGNEYSKALGDDASLCPLRKADFPGPRGPIAFEDRDIAESEISSTEECEVLIIGAGIGGLMGSLKAAEEGAKVITLEKMTEGRSAWARSSKRSRGLISILLSCAMRSTVLRIGASTPAPSKRT